MSFGAVTFAIVVLDDDPIESKMTWAPKFYIPEIVVEKNGEWKKEFYIPKIQFEHIRKVRIYSVIFTPCNYVTYELNGYVVGRNHATGDLWDPIYRGLEKYLKPGLNTLRLFSDDSREEQTAEKSIIKHLQLEYNVELPESQEGKWIPGLVHIHSTFSDGSDSIICLIEKAQAKGLQFIIFTDHLEQLENKEKGKREQIARKTGKYDPPEYGIENYVNQIMREDAPGYFSSIVGVEIMENHKIDSKAKTSHTLAIANTISASNRKQNLSPKLDELFQYQFKESGQQALLNALFEGGYVSIAAHPCYPDYPYDQSGVDKLRGIDCFSVGSIDKEDYLREELEFILSRIRAKKSVFVTSCSDYHGFLSAYSAPSLDRITWVCLDSEYNNRSTILQAFETGKTYAANQGAEITEMSETPGDFMPKKVKEVVLNFKVKLPGRKRHLASLYRDGDPTPISSQEIKDGEWFRYTDENVSHGIHRYIFNVPDLLITSPIALRVKKAEEN